jgi:hypothetical protein
MVKVWFLVITELNFLFQSILMMKLRLCGNAAEGTLFSLAGISPVNITIGPKVIIIVIFFVVVTILV